VKKLVYFFLLLLAIGCRDIQEKDIRNSQVELLSPPDNYRSKVLSQTFYWSKADGASAYRIQVAMNSFAPDSMVLVVDSVTRLNYHTKSLPYGKKYQWRVMAINSGYESPFTPPRTLYIDSSAEISFQKVALLSPADNLLTNKTTALSFSWESLSQASAYKFVMDSAGQPIYEPANTTETAVSYACKGEATYTWKVQAYDKDFKSTVFSSRSLIVDKTLPDLNQTAPADKIILPGDTVSLTWVATDKYGIVSDSLFVFTDSLSESPLTGYPILATKRKQLLTVRTPITKVWWQVSAVDAAGNRDKTDKRRITFQR
jgi:hypothetical protein